jgi:hypothetical protein
MSRLMLMRLMPRATVWWCVTGRMRRRLVLLEPLQSQLRGRHTLLERTATSVTQRKGLIVLMRPQSEPPCPRLIWSSSDNRGRCMSFAALFKVLGELLLEASNFEDRPNPVQIALFGLGAALVLAVAIWASRRKAEPSFGFNDKVPDRAQDRWVGYTFLDKRGLLLLAAAVFVFAGLVRGEALTAWAAAPLTWLFGRFAYGVPLYLLYLGVIPVPLWKQAMQFLERRPQPRPGWWNRVQWWFDNLIYLLLAARIEMAFAGTMALTHLILGSPSVASETTRIASGYLGALMGSVLTAILGPTLTVATLIALIIAPLLVLARRLRISFGLIAGFGSAVALFMLPSTAVAATVGMAPWRHSLVSVPGEPSRLQIVRSLDSISPTLVEEVEVSGSAKALARVGFRISVSDVAEGRATASGLEKIMVLGKATFSGRGVKLAVGDCVDRTGPAYGETTCTGSHDGTVRRLIVVPVAPALAESGLVHESFLNALNQAICRPELRRIGLSAQVVERQGNVFVLGRGGSGNQVVACITEKVN